jgi:hypothetical protein
MALCGQGDLARPQDHHPAVSRSEIAKILVERRRPAALVAGLVTAAAFLAADGEGPADTPAARDGHEPAIARAVAEVVDRPGAGPGPAVTRAPTVRARLERAEARGRPAETGETVDRFPSRTSCPTAVAGPVVEVTVSGVGCRAADPLVARLTARSRPGPSRLAGFACLPHPLRIDCSRAADAASVVLLFGPGGAGLEDCGQSPLDESGALGLVRTRGMSCDDARRRIFAAVSGGEWTELPGFDCAQREVAGVATAICRTGGEEIAFTLPLAEGRSPSG